ncbi:MAG: galactokinase, partial [Sphaerochaeta sp.]|nr:galactokinase [Sphaerochaeta sp.]
MATIKDIQNGALHPLYTGLYGSSHDAEDQDRRYTTLSEEHVRCFGQSSFSLFSTAGRSELG